MIKRRLLLGFLILISTCCIPSAFAAGADVLTGLGDSAYLRKKYDSAIFYYGQASAIGNPDAALLYKLGNAHYRLKNTGEAVLAYERALKRRPGFVAASENLAILRRQIQPELGRNEVFFMRWWQALTTPSTSNTWAVLGVLCFCFPLGVLIWSRFRRQWPSWLWPQAIVGGIMLSILFAVLAVSSVRGNSDRTGVVMRQDAALQLGTNKARGSVINLPEGLGVKVLRLEGAELRVALHDGREGLMQAADIALVE